MSNRVDIPESSNTFLGLIPLRVDDLMIEDWILSSGMSYSFLLKKVPLCNPKVNVLQKLHSKNYMSVNNTVYETDLYKRYIIYLINFQL